MEVDSDYEFNAPRYIDFLSTEDDNEDIDTWFDENPDGHDGGIRLSHVPFVGQHSNFQEATRAISAALADSDMEQSMQTSKVGQGNKTQATKSMPVGKAELQEQMTCDVILEKVKEEEQETKPEPVEDTRQQHEEETKQQPTEDAIQKVALQNIVNKERSETEKVEGDAVANTQENIKVEKDDSKMDTKSSKRRTRSNSTNQEKIAGSKLRKRKSSFTPSKLAQMKGGATNIDDSDAVGGKKAKFEMKKPLITMPNTPSFIRRLRGKTNQEKKTSEALEIERIKKLQEEMKKRLKSNESYLQKALAPQPVHQAKLATEVTKTVEFNFATDSRIKQHPMKTRGDNSENATFVGQLRKHPPSPTFKNRKPTKAMPFKFSSSSSSSFHKETKPDQVGKWQSVASAVNDFQTKTPERWRTRPASQQNSGPRIDDKNKTKMELTHPKTPQLMTKGRSRPVSVPSQADLESKTVEEISSYKFKAREFDHKIVERDGMYGVEPLKQLPPTEAKPFSFSSDRRLEQRKKQEEGKKEQEKIAKQQQQQQSKPGEKRNTSMDSCGGRKRPKITTPKPFSFENRDKQMVQKKQENIKKVLQEEDKAREFTARPLPSLSPDLIPVKLGKHTEFASFNLATDERGAVRMEKWTAQISKDLEEEKEKTTFKAQPCKVVHKEAFIPKPSAKPLVEVSEFRLNTKERSKKREDYEIMKKEQQRIKEDEMQLFLKEKKEEEEREIANLRKQATHKANPIRNFGEFEVRPSDRPLTLPETPKFETNRRFGKQSRV